VLKATFGASLEYPGQTPFQARSTSVTSTSDHPLPRFYHKLYPFSFLVAVAKPLFDSLENKCTINRSESALIIFRDEGRTTADEKECRGRPSFVPRRPSLCQGDLIFILVAVPQERSHSSENKCTVNGSQSAVMIFRDEGRATDDERVPRQAVGRPSSSVALPRRPHFHSPVSSQGDCPTPLKISVR